MRATNASRPSETVRWTGKARLLGGRLTVLRLALLVAAAWLTGTVLLSFDVMSDARLKRSATVAEAQQPLELGKQQLKSQQRGAAAAESSLQPELSRSSLHNQNRPPISPTDPYGVAAALAEAVPNATQRFDASAATLAVWRRERGRVEASVKQKLEWEAFKIKDGPRKVRHLKKRRALDPEEVDGATSRAAAELRRLYAVLDGLPPCGNRAACDAATLRQLYQDVRAFSNADVVFATARDVDILLRTSAAVGVGGDEADGGGASGGAEIGRGELAASLPAVHPTFACHKSCATIGNAATLATSLVGGSATVSSGGASALRNQRSIDEHRCILRVNQAPAGGKYAPYVGTRATFRVLNAAWVSRYVHPLKEDGALGNMIQSLEPNVTVVVTRASLHQFVFFRRVLLERRPDVTTLLLHPSVTSRVREVLERFRLGILRTIAASESPGEAGKMAGSAEFRRYARGGSTPSSGLVASLGLALGGGGLIGCIGDADATEGHPLSLYGFSEELSRDRDSMRNGRGSYHYFRATDWPDAPDLRAHPSHSFLLEGRLLRALRGQQAPDEESAIDVSFKYVRWCDGTSFDSCHTALNADDARIPAHVQRALSSPKPAQRRDSRRAPAASDEGSGINVAVEEPPGFPSIITPDMPSAKFLEHQRDANREIQLAITDHVMQTAGRKSKQPKGGAKESQSEAMERRRLAPITDTIDPIEVIEPMQGDEKYQGMAAFILRKERQRAAKAGFQVAIGDGGGADEVELDATARPVVVGEDTDVIVEDTTVQPEADDAERAVPAEAAGEAATDEPKDVAPPGANGEDAVAEVAAEIEHKTAGDGPAPSHEDGEGDSLAPAEDATAEDVECGESDCPLDGDGLFEQAAAEVTVPPSNATASQSTTEDASANASVEELKEAEQDDTLATLADVPPTVATEEQDALEAREVGLANSAPSVPPTPETAALDMHTMDPKAVNEVTTVLRKAHVKPSNAAAERAKRVKADFKRAEAAKMVPLNEIKDPDERAREAAWRAEEAQQAGEIPVECLKRGSSDPCFGQWLRTKQGGRPSAPTDAVRRATQNRLSRRKPA